MRGICKEGQAFGSYTAKDKDDAIALVQLM